MIKMSNSLLKVGRTGGTVELVDNDGDAQVLLNGEVAWSSNPSDASAFHEASHETIGVTRKARRCNPIFKIHAMNRINASASNSGAAWGIKLRLPCDFYGIRLHFFNQHANTPSWRAVIAATETAATDTSSNLGQPIVGGAAVTSLDSTTTNYGWRTATFANAVTGVHTSPVAAAEAAGFVSTQVIASGTTITIPWDIGTNNVDLIAVYKDGVRLTATTDYTVTATSTVTLAVAATGETYKIVYVKYQPSILSTDVIPCFSVPRADGGSGRLLMIRACSTDAAANKFTFGPSNAAMRTPTAANRGFIYQTWFGNNSSAVTSPSGFTPTALDANGTPILAIEVFTHAQGSTLLFVGDSLTANDGLVADATSSWGLRAAMDLSTEQNPVGFINCGCSAQTSATYYAAGLQQLNFFKPSAAFFPNWTPNDYSSPASADVVRYRIAGALARLSQFTDAAETLNTVTIPWTGFPNKASTGLNTAAKDDIRKSANTLLLASAQSAADFDGAVTDGASPAGFVPAYSYGDDVHVNEAAVELIGAGEAKDKAAIVLGLAA